MDGWTIHKYKEERDLFHINKWLQMRHQPEVDPYDIPEIGFMAMFKDRPIAAGFLRQIEGDTGLFDSLVSHPVATAEFRHIALDMVVNSIITSARSRNIKQVLAYTVDKGTLERAFRHNFVKLPHTVIALDLKNGPSH